MIAVSLLSLLFVFSFGEAKKSTKNFRVSPEITTGWTFCRNQALYASEYLYEQDREAFWTFFRALNTDQNIKSVGKSSIQDQQFILNLLKGTENAALLKINLEMETFAPKIQAKSSATKSLPDNCETVIEYQSGVYACSLDDLEGKDLSGVQASSFDFLKQTVDDDERHLIRIYTIAGSESFNSIADALQEMNFNIAVQLIAKPSSCTFYQEEVLPTGYGLEFEIKSSKYVVEEDQEEQEDDFENTSAVHKSLYNSLGVLQAFKDIKEAPQVQSKALKQLRQSKTFSSILDISTNIPVNYERFKSSKPAGDQKIDHQIQFRINDLELRSANLDPFRLLDFMNIYTKISSDLSKFVSGVDRNVMKKLLHSRIDSQASKSSSGVRYELVSKAMTFLNDLQTDRRYSGWPKSFDHELDINEFYAKNILTVVVPIDFDAKESSQLLESLIQMVSYSYPLRLAIQPIVKDASSDWIKAYYAVREKYGLRTSTGFLKNAIQMYQSSSDKAILNLLLEQLGLDVEINDGESLLQESSAICKRFQISMEEVFANGRILPITQNLPEVLMNFYKQELEEILSVKELKKEDKDLYAALLKHYKARDRKSGSSTDMKYNSDLSSGEIRVLLDIKHYTSKKSNEKLSVWIASEYDRKDSFSLFIMTLKAVIQSDSIRLRAFVTNAMTSMPNRMVLAASAVLTDCSSKETTKVLEFLETFYENYFGAETEDFEIEAIKHSGEDIVKKLMNIAANLDDPVVKEIQAENEFFFEVYDNVDYEQEVLLSLNGNSITIHDEIDLDELISIELENNANRYHKIAKKQHEEDIGRTVLAFSIFEAKLLNQLDESLSYLITPSTTPFPRDKNTIEIGNDGKAIFNVEAVFNPFNREGQKFASIMSYLAGSDLFYFRLVLVIDQNANDDPKDARIYRFVTPESKGSPIPVAQVSDSEVLLAMSLDLPAAWMTVATFANADLDNIRPTKVPHLHASFSLSHIIIEGQAKINDENESIATGRIVQLYNEESGLMVDETLVMANFGYYQLKAGPGRWNLRVIHEGLEYPIISGGSTELTSFSGTFNRISISNEGHEIEKTGLHIKKPQADVNVFSLASGLFYERLLRIMIFSVIKQLEDKEGNGDKTENSTRPIVKFWLLETTLSAQGLLALEGLSKEYNFEYELMAYKWPSWLNPQSKKHRTIWAYKILFLDVLFPQSLDRIIFIDADQVVRSNLMELVELDLKGHVYAMTPFCGDKAEMAPYRFWEHNYWKNHLQGRPYHISALFVVDLKELRKQSVADIIRAEYHVLSRDPNSLANLDQDLPNNLQHHIPIYSLPQEWLWCDTWCTAASKSKAKTIDLCNNPKTFESKFDQAQRIIPEWKSYDEEIKRVLERTKKEYQQNLKSFSEHVEL